MASFLSKVTRPGSAVWEELVEPQASPTFTATRDMRSITRYFRVPQADMGDLIDECFPPSTGFFPQLHPTYDLLYVNDVNGSPFPGSNLVEIGGHSEPEYYMAAVTYTPLETTPQSNPPDPTQPQDVLTGNCSFTTQSMTLPGYGGLQWETGSVDIKEPEVQPFMVIPIAQFTILVPRARTIPWAAMRANRGRINLGPFWGASPQTVMYTGMNINYRFSSDGSKQFDIEHHFSERQIVWNGQTYGWNHYYDSTNKRFDRVVNSDGNPFYEAVNTFSALFA